MRLLRPWLAVILLFGRLAAQPAATPAPSPVATPMLYPHAPAPSVGQPAASSGIGMTGLAGVLLAAAGGAWLLWSRQRGNRGWTGRSERLLAIAETRALGNRQYLVVAAYGKRRFLLGVCPSRIDMLSPLDDEIPHSP